MSDREFQIIMSGMTFVVIPALGYIVKQVSKIPTLVARQDTAEERIKSLEEFVRDRG